MYKQHIGHTRNINKKLSCKHYKRSYKSSSFFCKHCSCIPFLQSGLVHSTVLSNSSPSSPTSSTYSPKHTAHLILHAHLCTLQHPRVELTHSVSTGLGILSPVFFFSFLLSFFWLALLPFQLAFLPFVSFLHTSPSLLALTFVAPLPLPLSSSFLPLAKLRTAH